MLGMRSKGRLRVIGLFSLMVVVLAGCAPEAGSPGSTSSRLTLRLATANPTPSSDTLRTLTPPHRQAVTGDPDFIAKLSVSIEASDINPPMRKDFILTADNQTEVTVEFVSVPIGTNRLITVVARNEAEQMVFTGNTTVDLTGESQVVEIRLQRVFLSEPPTAAKLANRTFAFSSGGVFNLNQPILLVFGDFTDNAGSFTLLSTASASPAQGRQVLPAELGSGTVTLTSDTSCDFAFGSAAPVTLGCAIDGIDGRLQLTLGGVSSVSAPPNGTPNAAIDTPAQDTTILLGEAVDFSGTCTDPDKQTPFSFAWNFAGGAMDVALEDPGPTTFNIPGTFQVTFTCTDALGATDIKTDVRTITVVPTGSRVSGAPIPPNGTLTVKVHDLNSGVALAGTTVIVDHSNDPRQIATTTAGEATFTIASGGPVTVTVVGPDLAEPPDGPPGSDYDLFTIVDVNASLLDIALFPRGLKAIVEGVAVNFTGPLGLVIPNQLGEQEFEDAPLPEKENLASGLPGFYRFETDLPNRRFAFSAFDFGASTDSTPSTIAGTPSAPTTFGRDLTFPLFVPNPITPGVTNFTTAVGLGPLKNKESLIQDLAFPATPPLPTLTSGTITPPATATTSTLLAAQGLTSVGDQKLLVGVSTIGDASAPLSFDLPTFAVPGGETNDIVAIARDIDGSESLAIQRNVVFGGSNIDFPTMLEPPGNLSPNGLTTLSLPLQLVWSAVPNASLYLVEVMSNDVDWTIVLPPTVPGVSLPDLTGTPVEEAGLSPSAPLVRWEVQAVSIPNFDFNRLDQDVMRQTFTHTSRSTPAVIGPPLYGAAQLDPNGISILYRIDPTTGHPFLIGSIGFERVSGMDFDPVNNTMYATGERIGSNTHVLLTIDLNTGAGQEVAPTGVESLTPTGASPLTVSDISFKSDGTLFAYIQNNTDFGGLGTINVSGGTLTFLGNTVSAGQRGNGIAFSLSEILFHADDLNVETLDQTTGVATTVVPMGFPPLSVTNNPRINTMDVHPLTGELYGSLNNKVVGSGLSGTPENYLVKLDPATGNVAILGPTVGGLDALAFVPITGVSSPVSQ